MTTPRNQDGDLPEEGARGRLAWRTYRQAASLILRGATIRAGLKVALVVGTVLSAVNLGAAIAGGHATDATWARLAVNYVVPYLVASFGFLEAYRVHDAA